MRPLKLTMSAFGSYRDETVIDFKTLGDRGLFLVCGDTGAGKTTIFDAISFALFGEPSGSSRKSDMFNSELAQEGTQTWVELEFQYSGKVYKARRSTDYNKPKQRGEGFTPVRGDASLTMPDGAVIAVKNDVNKKIIEILGIDRAQFAQIAMIAQGEFQKLLTAPTDERSELFGRLLKTKTFVALQESLKKQYSQQDSLCQELKRAAEQCLQGVRLAPEDTHNKEKLSDAGNGDFSAAAEAIRSAIDFDEKILEETDVKFAESERKIADINVSAGKAQNIEKLRESLADANKKLETARQENEAARQDYEAEEENEPVRAGLSDAIASLKAEFPQYEELENLKSAGQETKNAITKIEKCIKTLRDKQAKIQDETAALKTEKESLSGIAAEKARLDGELKSAESLLADLTELNEAYAAFHRMQKELSEKTAANKRSEAKRVKVREKADKELAKIREDEKNAAAVCSELKDADVTLERERTRLTALREETAQLEDLSARLEDIARLSSQIDEKQKEFQKAEKNYAAQQEKYETMQQRFLSAQAGVIASNLHDGTPCPVCGSLSHPAPAELSDDIPGEDSIKKAKEKAETADAKRAGLSMDAGTLLASLNEKNSEIRKAAGKILGEPLPVELANAVTEKSAETDTQRAACEASVSTFTEAVKKRDSAVSEQSRLKELADKIAGEAEETAKLHSSIAAAEEAEINKQTGILSGAEESLKARHLKFFGSNCTEDPEAMAVSSAEAAADSLTQIKDAIDEADKKDTREKELGRLIPQKETAAAELAEELLAEEKKLSENSQKRESNEEQRKALARKLTFDNANTATKELGKIAAQLNKLKESLELSRSKLNKSETNRSSAEGTAKGLEKELEGAGTEENLETLQKSLSDEMSEKSRLSEIKVSTETRLSVNRQASAGLAEKTALLAASENKLQLIKPVSDTMNGTLAGKPRITLETWVQTAWFDRILARANVRLMKMSDGQYELKRREDDSTRRGKIGLEIDAADHYSGKRRDVKTLSGGESFMASLSLALGLSDEVQYMAGGVKLDTLFVDEGFGSLDDETLDKAMRVLSELSDGSRLIGIISHVGALKDRIDRQIAVTKDRINGSRAEIKI